MRKVIGITIAVFMLAGSLVGCGNSDTEKSKTATTFAIKSGKVKNYNENDGGM